MGTWKTIEPNMWKPENSGDNIIGVLISKDASEGDFSAKYYLENEAGRFLVWGSAVLDDRMRFVNIGQKCKVTFKGMAKNKRKQDVKLFQVEVEA